ncbi:hypothetical protein SRABI26_03342 [Arthrobacter sp. Bi26]|nr:hypothetical protein SRABI26_03342 [Arthrobacter sp. Bi26]
MSGTLPFSGLSLFRSYAFLIYGVWPSTSR